VVVDWYTIAEALRFADELRRAACSGKAITIRQPWARCIAVGAKTVENRGRPVQYRGRIAIHAGRTADVAADHDPRVVRLYGPDPRIGAPVGAVIAVADLVDCHKAAPSTTDETCCAPWGERYHQGPSRRVVAWHLVLANVVALDRHEVAETLRWRKEATDA
jgi:hypothetical protein